MPSTMLRPQATRGRRRLGLLTLLLAVVTLGLPLPSAMAAAPVTVSLVFNDGLSTQYRNASPVLASHGAHGTFYVASSWVKSNDAKYMRFYHLDELYRQGNEIGGMGKDHKSLTATYDPDASADAAYKRDQVCGDHQTLTDWGYHPVSFAYPGAAENGAVQTMVRDCGFTTGRIAGGLAASGPVYAEPIPPGNAMRLRALATPAGALTLQTLQNAVTAAGDHGGGWLPIAFNDVCSSADASYSTCMAGNKPIDAAVLGSFLDWLDSRAAEGVSVRTVRQVMGSEQPPLPARPFAVSLTFDDGLASQYGLRDIFARHNMHGSFYINSGPVDAGEAGTMSWGQIRNLQAAGHDVGGHTRDHVNMLATDTSYEFKTRQTCDDRQRLLEEGINAVSFAYPFGAMDATAQTFPKGCGYQSARKAGTVTSDGPIYSETIPVTENPYAVRILGTNENGPVTLAALQYAVNQATKYGGSWLPTLFHQICYVGTANYGACMAGYRPVDDATIDSFLSWIESQSDRNIRVRTVADIMGGGSTASLVSVTGPVAGSTASTARPTLTGTATGGGTVTASLYQGDYSVGTPVRTLSASPANGQWSVTPGTDLPDGTYTVQASQPSGNATGTSVPVRFTVDATSAPTDTEAPEVVITSPSEGDTVRTTTPTISGNAGSLASDDAEVSVRFFSGSSAGGTPAHTATAPVSASGAWSVEAPAIADGVYTVEASQADRTGNVGTSAPVSFTVDTTPVDTTAPSVTITSPADGDTVERDDPTIRGTAGTAAGDDSQVQVVLSPSAESGDEVQTLVAEVATNGSWSVTPLALADGVYTIQASQTDASANIGTSTAVSFTVTTRPNDTTAPSVTITSPANGASLGTADVAVSGASGVAEGDATTVDVDVYSGSSATGTPVQSLTAAATAGTWSVTVSGLAAGTYTLRASQQDAAGNVGRSQPVTFTRSAALAITSVSPSWIGRGASAATVTVNGSGFDASTSIAVSGSGVSSAVTARSSNQLTLRVNVTINAATGSRNVTASSNAGGSVRCSRCLSVVAGPTISGVSPSSLRRGQSRTVTINGALFRSGQMTVEVSGTRVSVSNIRVLGSTRMTVVLSASSTAALSTRSLTVVDRGTSGSATRSSAITVTR